MKNKNPILLGEAQVRDALRWIADILNWSQIQFVLLGDLAKQIKDNEYDIKVDKIEIGIKKNSWSETTKSLVRTFLMNTPYQGMDLEMPLEFEMYGVPIKVRLITRNYEFMKNTDTVTFWTDLYQIPNPFEKYYKARYLIK